jgi:hypothetical protein
MWYECLLGSSTRVWVFNLYNGRKLNGFSRLGTRYGLPVYVRPAGPAGHEPGGLR